MARFLLAHAAIGAGTGAGLAAALLATDTLGLATLTMSAHAPPVTAIALLLGGAAIFAPFSIATALALLARHRPGM